MMGSEGEGVEGGWWGLIKGVSSSCVVALSSSSRVVVALSSSSCVVVACPATCGRGFDVDALSSPSLFVDRGGGGRGVVVVVGAVVVVVVGAVGALFRW
jgi:hypothetical protein